MSSFTSLVFGFRSNFKYEEILIHIVSLFGFVLMQCVQYFYLTIIEEIGALSNFPIFLHEARSPMLFCMRSVDEILKETVKN